MSAPDGAATIDPVNNPSHLLPTSRGSPMSSSTLRRRTATFVLIMAAGLGGA